MRILFLHPINLYRRWPVPVDFVRFGYNPPAVTYPQLAACLPPGHPCALIDGIVEKADVGKLTRQVRDSDVVALNSYHPGASLNTELNIRLIRKIKPEIKIVMGGMHPTFFAEEWIERGVDFVVRGEGENTFCELIDRLESGDDLQDVRGISYRSDGRTIHNPDREPIKDLDTLPMPRWDLAEMSRYGNRSSDRITATMETSRGCAYQCDFCVIPYHWKGPQRYKSVERTIDELLYLKKLGVRKLWVADNTFGNNQARDMELLEQMLRHDLKINWYCFARVDTILEHPEFYRLASRAGLECALVGFETLNEEKLATLNKGYRKRLVLDDYRRAYRTLKGSSIFTVGLLMVGFPGDSRKDVAETMTEYGQICDFPFLSPLRPERGTPLYGEFQDKQDQELFYYDAQIKYADFERFKAQWVYLTVRSFMRPAPKLILGNRFERHYYQDFYKHLLMGIAGFNIHNLIDFLYLAVIYRDGICYEDYRRHIVGRYRNWIDRR